MTTYHMDLYREALTKVNQQVGQDRTYKQVGKDLYEIIREVADALLFGSSENTERVLQIAVEDTSFVTTIPDGWSFTSWEEAGNACTPLALIRENIYLWLIDRLEDVTDCGKEESA